MQRRGRIEAGEARAAGKARAAFVIAVVAAVLGCLVGGSGTINSITATVASGHGGGPQRFTLRTGPDAREVVSKRRPPTEAARTGSGPTSGNGPRGGTTPGSWGKAVPGRVAGAKGPPPGPAPTNVPPIVPPGWTATNHTIQVGSLQRSYLLVRPPLSETPLPVLVMLHGRDLTPSIMERIAGFPRAFRPSIQVYPTGYGQSWNAGACCSLAHDQHIDDVTFLTKVVNQVLSSQPDADPKEVDLVGYSNGGRMAYRMACADPGVFETVAAVEAVPVAACDRTDPVPIDIVASSDDPLLTISGGPPKVIEGYTEPTVADVLATWRALDGCSDQSTVKTSGLLRVTTWAHCKGRGQVVFSLYQGGSHAWPEGGGVTPSAQLLLAGFMGQTAATMADRSGR